VAVDGRVSALLSLGTGFNNALSGRENIVLSGLTLGYSYDEIRDRMDSIIEFAELGDFIDVPARYYSSGMLARLSFSIVVTMEPDILLIDETLSVGDLAFAKKAQTAMHNVLQCATCQIIVSHNLSTLNELCSRALLIDHGRVLADGQPKHVIAEYERLVGMSGQQRPPSPAELVNGKIELAAHSE
ncbi:MAG: ABC transporter ATP-binding protein, partial [Variovorax sp.]